MKAMILAAGYGKRLSDITKTKHKSLIEVQGKPLIVHHVERLAAAGTQEIVINLHYLGEQIEDVLGDGSQFDTEITYLWEPDLLDSGGGVLNALPFLGPSPFIVLNADVYTDYPFHDLHLPENKLAHFILVENPLGHADGDFSIENNVLTNTGSPRYTFSGIRVYHPDLFQGCEPGPFSIVPIWREKVEQGLISGEYYSGIWHDVGTPERLEQLQLEME
ncbi:MAG: mannose-1-phosphate guanylyltransferase [marine bacterium B5-7]|nr:MAG: mannose-1-phosphate guanylyltransferase [marine bacterium B5-7]